MHIVPVTDIRGEARVSSRDLAAALGNQHKNVMSLLKKYESEFVELGEIFYQAFPSSAQGGQPIKVAFLNEEHCYFFLTLVRTSDTKTPVKAQYAQAFADARARLTGAEPSPFAACRHTRPDGSEFWSARELQILLGYDTWRNFAESIERARAACDNAGQDSRDHFVGASKMVRVGSGAERDVLDYHLTRYACYLVAMNGDPRKAEIAAAQTYFAVKTHQAERTQVAAAALTAAPVGMEFLQQFAGNVLVAIEQQAVQTKEEVKTELRQEITQALADRPIQGSQPNMIQGRVRRLALLMGGQPKDFAEAWRRFKNRFDVAAYRDLLAGQFDDAIQFLDLQIASYDGGNRLLEE